MTFHAILAYLRYRRKAMGRHGTHSPFVYDFIERVLLDREVIAREYIVVSPGLALRFENIVSRIAAHYQYKSILVLPEEKDLATKEKVDLMLIAGDASQWQKLFEKYYLQLHPESAVIVTELHRNREHTAAWNKLCNDQSVKMSIDLYGIGILLFRKEFKVRQRFVLKY